MITARNVNLTLGMTVTTDSLQPGMKQAVTQHEKIKIFLFQKLL